MRGFAHGLVLAGNLGSYLAYYGEADMREEIGEPFRIASVLKHVPISRRLFELLCRRRLGCAPAQYAQRIRVEHAKQLLASQEKLKLQHLAKRCGFSGARHFRDAFRRMTGMTPAEYRRLLARDRSALPRAATAPPP